MNFVSLGVPPGLVAAKREEPPDVQNIAPAPARAPFFSKSLLLITCDLVSIAKSSFAMSGVINDPVTAMDAHVTFPRVPRICRSHKKMIPPPSEWLLQDGDEQSLSE